MFIMEPDEMIINAENPNQTLEGMHSIVFDFMKELTKLEDENMIITECHLQCKFVKGPGVHEYEQFQDGDLTITIDKTSLETAKREMDTSDI